MLLIMECSQAFASHNLSFTVSFNGRKEILVHALNYADIQQYVDFIQFSIEPVYRNSSADELKKGERISDLNYTTTSLINLGVTQKKIIIGIKKFCGLEINITQLANKCLYCRGMRNWQQISLCAEIPKEIIKIRERCEFESARSIANQIRFLMKQDIAGVMVYALNFYNHFLSPLLPVDTFADFTPTKGITFNFPQNNGEQYPLLQTINEAMLVTHNEIIQTKEKMIRKLKLS